MRTNTTDSGNPASIHRCERHPSLCWAAAELVRHYEAFQKVHPQGTAAEVGNGPIELVPHVRLVNASSITVTTCQ